MKNNLIYFGAEWCPQCKACKPQIEKECQRLNIPFAYKEVEDSDKGKQSELGEQRHLPYAILTIEGQVVKGNAWDILDDLKKI